MKGRKPKPKTLKILDGTRKDRIPEASPEPETGLPPCPSHLSIKAKTLWKKLSQQLVEMGTAKVDAIALERLCSVYSRIRECEAVIKSGGLTYEAATENGVMIRPRPEVSILAVAEKELRAILAEFGLTPSSRCRIDLGKLGVQPKQAAESVSSFARKRG